MIKSGAASNGAAGLRGMVARAGTGRANRIFCRKCLDGAAHAISREFSAKNA
jgi:hypothetical protein